MTPETSLSSPPFLDDNDLNPHLKKFVPSLSSTTQENPHTQSWVPDSSRPLPRNHWGGRGTTASSTSWTCVHSTASRPSSCSSKIWTPSPTHYLPHIHHHQQGHPSSHPRKNRRDGSRQQNISTASAFVTSWRFSVSSLSCTMKAVSMHPPTTPPSRSCTFGSASLASSTPI